MDSLDPVLVDVPMPITTPRLVLRPGAAGDGNALADAKRESWSELSRWLDFASGSVESISDLDDEVYVRKKQAEFILRQDLWLLAIDRTSGRLIGTTGFHAIDWNARVMATGFWIRTTETKKGYATELTIALVRYAFQALRVRRLTMSHADGNEGSRRVIEKLGFEKEGIARKSYLLRGALTDAHHYARLDDAGLPALPIEWGRTGMQEPA